MVVVDIKLWKLIVMVLPGDAVVSLLVEIKSILYLFTLKFELEMGDFKPILKYWHIKWVLFKELEFSFELLFSSQCKLKHIWCFCCF